MFALASNAAAQAILARPEKICIAIELFPKRFRLAFERKQVRSFSGGRDMKKYHLLAGALAMLAIAPAEAQQYQTLQTWNTSDSIAGVPGPSNTFVTPPWSIHSNGTAVTCNKGPTPQLTINYTGNGHPILKGKGDSQHPDVTKRFGGTDSVPGTGMLVPQGSIVMHPGGGAAEQCVILRFTVPPIAAPLQRVYKITSNFKGAYPIPPAMAVPGHPGCNTSVPECGVRGMVRVKRSWAPPGQQDIQLGNAIDTAQMIGGGSPNHPFVALRPGDTVDFAVWNKGDYGFDSTLLVGTVERQN